MCVGSLIIACAPTYASVGMLAPALLLFARLLQGLSVGGEYGKAPTYLTEMAGKNHRGFFSSFQYVTLISGQLLALCVLIILQRTMSEAQYLKWGWRPSLLHWCCTCPLWCFGFVVDLVETQSSKDAQNRLKYGDPNLSALALFTKYPKQAFAVIMLTAGGDTGIQHLYYLFTKMLRQHLRF